MASVNLKSLVAKLNDTCRRTLEGAAGLCLSRTNYNVEIEHWLLKLLEVNNSDLHKICQHYGIDMSRLQADLTATVDRLKTGNGRPPALSPTVVELARDAWLLGSIEYGASATRSGHLLLALLSSDMLAPAAHDASSQFAKINPETLKQELPSVVDGSAESQGDVASAPRPGGGQPVRPGAKGTAALDQFTIDLTAQAKAGKIDPVLGRDAEIRQVIDILMRRRQNNPIMTGEAGVGKTAVVEGFALRVAQGDVPPALQNVAIRTLDLGLLQAGAGVKGEFENRLRSVIDEVKASPQPIILFIDEAHTLIGAGGQAGQGDAANLLKPALARGELRTIAATTWAEYKKYFEKDPALTRRFQVVKVEEPNEDVGVQMIRGLVKTLEKHHGVRVLDEAVTDAVKLSNRYISGRQLPDKAVSLLDTACARVALSQAATPAEIEDCRRRIEQLAVARDMLQREEQAGSDHADRIRELAESKVAAETLLESLETRWKEEKELVDRVRAIQSQLAGEPVSADAAPPNGKADAAAEPAATATAPPSDAERADLKKQLDALTQKLAALQGEEPLMHVCVNGQAIADIVSNWTGIPVGRMVSNEIQTVLNLKDKLEERIVGQSHGLQAIAEAIQTSRAKMTDPRRPVGVFMLAGPSGVGKTETAIALSDLLFGGEQNMTVINMSEFKEEHKVSLLMGSPPGYVGYGEGGVLTEAVRRRPYSVVLLDELEKAHEGVQEIFYQVFDKGILRDGEGRDIDFKNTVIIMTSNAGTDLVMKLCADPDTAPEPEGLASAMHQELLKTFKPAFLGRATVIPYFPLSDDVLRGIIELKLGKVVDRVKANYNATLSYTPAVVESILGRCQEVESGARNVDHILSRTLLPELSAEFLSRMAAGDSISAIQIDIGDENRFEYALS
ncbi:MAG: type VI secretion system ATPase TssH [Planctomycetales bacterium]|nr:type VI secretion system ATPase TssH [Planctomycetales bacterium]